MLDDKVKSIETILGISLSDEEKEEIKYEFADLGLCVSMDSNVEQECADFCVSKLKEET
jgi:hypothetical protein